MAVQFRSQTYKSVSVADSLVWMTVWIPVQQQNRWFCVGASINPTIPSHSLARILLLTVEEEKESCMGVFASVFILMSQQESIRI